MFLYGTVAFLAGLFVGSFIPYLPIVVLILLIIAATALTILEHAQRLTTRQGRLLFGSLLAGVVYWAVSVGSDNSTGQNLLGHAGENPVMMVGTVVEPVRHAPSRSVVVLQISQYLNEGQWVSVAGWRLRLTWRAPDLMLRHGDVVSFAAKIRAPSGLVNPGGFDYGAYLERHGIDAVASLSGPGQIRVLDSGAGLRWVVWRQIDEWRDRIRQAAMASLSGPALGIYLGMIIGESDYLDPEVRDLFMATGTVHILSISGSHLGLITFLTFVVVIKVCQHLPTSWLLALSRRITATRLATVITAVLVVFYTLLAGAQVATVRSLVMILIFLLAVWLGRDNSLLLALAVAALVILLHDPQALFDISFQLSYLSVLAIALIAHRRSGNRQDDRPSSSIRSKAWRWIHEYILITGGVTLATTPLVAYYFNQIAWLGVVGNVVIVPLAGFLFVPVGLGSAVWLLIAGGDALPAGALNQGLCDVQVEIVRRLATIPGAEWHVASPAIPLIAVFYLLLAVAVSTRMATRLRWGASLAVLLLVLWWAWSPRNLPDRTLRVTFLDVGQGDACVLELPDGQTVLIDGGAAYDTFDIGRAVVAPYLWDQGIRRVDHVIGTHPQLDHVGGLAWTIQKFSVGEYWGNGLTREEPFYRRLQKSLQEQGLQERVAEEGRLIIDSGPCRLRILNPPAGNHEARSVPVHLRSGSLLNNLSVVTRLDCGPHSFLFTADVETDALARLARSSSLGPARVIKVPHHGARSSLNLQWIAETRAEIAVVSVGRTNPYGHPVPAVLAAYTNAGTRLFRTDQQGAVRITATLSSPDLVVEAAREHLLQPIQIGSAMWGAEQQNLVRLWSQWLHP